jgi:hypothetical protein
MQFQIRWFMAAVAILAVLLSEPFVALFFLILSGIVAAMILVPTAMAPRRRRVEVAYWATALHPLLLLGWLAVWRFILDPRPLGYRDSGWYFNLTLQIPWFLAWLSRCYLLAFFAVGAALANTRFAGRAIAVPMWTLLASWLLTWAILEWDPFAMSRWFWD